MSLINSKNNKGFKGSHSLTPRKFSNDSDNLPPVRIYSWKDEYTACIIEISLPLI